MTEKTDDGTGIFRCLRPQGLQRAQDGGRQDPEGTTQAIQQFGQQDARLRVRISYSTTELGRRLRGQERVILWGSNWRVVRGHAQERAEVMQAMLESEISYA